MHSLTTEQTEKLIFESYHRREILHGDDANTRDLTPIRAVYERAGVPLAHIPTITVAGSKGKGSTASFAAALLQGAGEKVGLLTSPHYLTHRERIRFNGVRISEADHNRIATALAPHIRAISNRLKPAQYLSPNGLFIAIGMRYFIEQGATVVVLEAGRGGRFDEASLFGNQVAIITRIDYEHTAQLGTSLAQIAWHKAGIIQPTTTLITGSIPTEALSIIEAEQAQISRHAHLAFGRDFMLEVHTKQGGQSINIHATNGTELFEGVCPTDAPFQAHNLALAFMGARALKPDIDWQDASNILASVQLFGRAQKVSEYPPAFVDGAIHAHAAQAFLDSVLAHSPSPRILLGAYPADKDGAGVLTTLAPFVYDIILTQPEDGYLSYDDHILHIATSFHPDSRSIPHVAEALAYAKKVALAQKATLWCVGTQSLVRAALQAYDIDLKSILKDQKA